MNNPVKLTIMNKIFCVALLMLLSFGCTDDEQPREVSGPRPVSLTSHIENGLSQTKTFTYDAKGRLATLTKSGEVVSFSYESNNQLRRIQSASQTFYLYYDQDGKLLELYNVELSENAAFTYQGNNSYLVDGILIAFNENGDFRQFDDNEFGYSGGKGPFANVKHLNMLGLYLADDRSLMYGAIARRQSITIDGVSAGYNCDDAADVLPTSETIGETQYSYTYE